MTIGVLNVSLQVEAKSETVTYCATLRIYGVIFQCVKTQSLYALKNENSERLLWCNMTLFHL